MIASTSVSKGYSSSVPSGPRDRMAVKSLPAGFLDCLTLKKNMKFEKHVLDGVLLRLFINTPLSVCRTEEWSSTTTTMPTPGNKRAKVSEFVQSLNPRNNRACLSYISPV